MPAANYGDILVRCPMPEHAEEPAQRLEDFMQSEIGQRVLGNSVKNIDVLMETGMGQEQAITIALGSVAVRDKEGNLQREPKPEAAAAAPQPPQLAESKKK